MTDSRPDWPRAMRRTDAAAYCGVSLGTFRKYGPPESCRLTPEIPLWLRDDLDRFLDRLAGRTGAGDAWLDAVKRHDGAA